MAGENCIASQLPRNNPTLVDASFESSIALIQQDIDNKAIGIRRKSLATGNASHLLCLSRLFLRRTFFYLMIYHRLSVAIVDLPKKFLRNSSSVETSAFNEQDETGEGDVPSLTDRGE